MGFGSSTKRTVHTCGLVLLKKKIKFRRSFQLHIHLIISDVQSEDDPSIWRSLQGEGRWGNPVIKRLQQLLSIRKSKKSKALEVKLDAY